MNISYAVYHVADRLGDHQIFHCAIAKKMVISQMF